jgi:hypothetical protein
MTTEEMTEEEIRVFSSKLEEFGNQLSPPEQSLLLMILGRPDLTEEQDVQGHQGMVDPVIIVQTAQHITHLHSVGWQEAHLHIHSLVGQLARQLSGARVHVPPVGRAHPNYLHRRG